MSDDNKPRTIVTTPCQYKVRLAEFESAVIEGEELERIIKGRIAEALERDYEAEIERRLFREDDGFNLMLTRATPADADFYAWIEGAIDEIKRRPHLIPIGRRFRLDVDPTIERDPETGKSRLVLPEGKHKVVVDDAELPEGMIEFAGPSRTVRLLGAYILNQRPASDIDTREGIIVADAPFDFVLVEWPHQGDGEEGGER